GVLGRLLLRLPLGFLYRLLRLLLSLRLLPNSGSRTLRLPLPLLFGRLGHLRLGLGHGHALCIDRLGLLLRNDHLVLDAPPPLAYARPLAHLLAQVVELRPPDVAPSSYLELLDLRRVKREGPLHPHPE